MECDISGWDRRLSVMKEIYDIRTAFIQCPSEFESKLKWTIKNTLESKMLLPNGDVVQKVGASNCSGSGTTTSDNCIGHVIINEYADALMKALLGEHCFTYSEMDFLTWCDIYGDDILKSYSTKLWEFLRDGSFVKDLYKQFNLIVKDTAFKVQKGPIGMTFLGAKVVLFDNTYFLPAYDSDRIYTALCLNIEDPGKNPDIEATKAYSLMMLAWNDIPLFNAIRSYLLNMLADSSIHGDFLGSLVKRGLPSRKEVIYSFWLNCESNDHYSMMSEVGGRVLKEVVQQCNSFKHVRHYNGYGSIQENEVRNDESSIPCET
jgi:hypothetical protein